MGINSRSKNSILNAISAMMLTLVNGLFGVVVTKMVISHYGSDFNGLNSTANQIVNMLLILEGGFTVASNVSLFAPLTKGDYNLVNGILSATLNKFRKIGALFLGIGSVVAVGYGFLVNSSLKVEFIITVILMTVFPAAFNLFYATTYRVLLQTQQKEYVISFITMLTIGSGHIANMIMMSLNGPMWAIRFITMSFAIFNSLLIAGYTKSKNKFINLKVEPQQQLIQGTKDVMVQKITGVIYNSFPIVFLSISPTGGTILASVYAVYNQIFTMIKSLLHAAIDAPRLSFGQLLTEKKREEVWPVFKIYEFIAFFAVFVLLSTCAIMILPFVKLYTEGINDANYYDAVIAVLMVSIAVIEMIHIPSGHLLNMAGKFKISKNFQLIACITLLITMTVGGAYFGVYGMLAALLLCAVILAMLEMGYVHLMFFKNKLFELFNLIFPFILIGITVCYLESLIPITINSYLSFFVYGLLFFAINTIIALLIGFIFNKKIMLSLLTRAKKLILKK